MHFALFQAVHAAYDTVYFQQFMLFVSVKCKMSSHFISGRCRPSPSQGFLLFSLTFALLGLGLVLAVPSTILATIHYSCSKFYVHNRELLCKVSTGTKLIGMIAILHVPGVPAITSFSKFSLPQNTLEPLMRTGLVKCGKGLVL